MRRCLACVAIVASIIAALLLTRKSIVNLCDLKKCPYCYGTDLCEDIDKIALRFDNWNDLFYNYISVKNVYIAEYRGVRVVLKKLRHISELRQLDAIVGKTEIDKNTVLDYLKTKSESGVKNFVTCDELFSELFLKKMANKKDWRQIWTILQTNVEPIILEMFRNENGWPVPKYYGACGRLIVVKHCGLPLNSFRSSNWVQRAYLSQQLLEAAINFTERHSDFRIYLTDVSPDNIAVDGDFNLFFIDLENAILAGKTGSSTLHQSQHFKSDDGFVYSEDEICASSISDHNIYAVCQLLLSKNAPWPMMRGGLLHSTPHQYKHLTDLVENCVNPGGEENRFQIASKLVQLFKTILLKNRA